MRRFAFVVALLIPHLAYAWGGEGHQLVALIAENQLTPASKAMVADLLGTDTNISDAEVASWADQIRREKRATAPWHYVNIPVTADAFDETRDGRKGANVIDKLDEQGKILGDKSTPREKRIEALKWVVHLAGDIHQPLHCAERDKDKGGNGVLVTYPGQKKPLKLHVVWDTWLVKDLVAKRPIAEVAEALNAKITPTQLKEWAGRSPRAWANESHRIAVEHVYAGIPSDGATPSLDAAYVDKSKLIVAEQMQRAGTRLAWMLNEASKNR